MSRGGIARCCAVLRGFRDGHLSFYCVVFVSDCGEMVCNSRYYGNIRTIRNRAMRNVVESGVVAHATAVTRCRVNSSWRGHILWQNGKTPTPALPLSTGRG